MSSRNSISRREVLRRGFLGLGVLGASGGLSSCSLFRGGEDTDAPDPMAVRMAGKRSRVDTPVGRIGRLQPPDENGILLPPGFHSRVLAVAGEVPVPGGRHRWHPFPDGGAVFPQADGGWVYVSNSEVGGHRAGGCGALRFNARGDLIDCYPILRGTTNNCAGGTTPWGTWLSCEEIADGRVWECDPLGRSRPRMLPALGRFHHEAVAVDPVQRIVYLTEDQRDGRLYRFVPDDEDWPAGAARGRLERGRLEVARVTGGAEAAVAGPRNVRWLPVHNPQDPQGRNRHPDATAFNRGEGMWFHQGIVYFSTTGDERIWAYDTGDMTLQAIYDLRSAPWPMLTGVDNLTVGSRGDIFVAEDGGNMELIAILPDRSLVRLLRIHGQAASEIAGPAFSPDGRRLYLSSQRGGRNGGGLGITYEIQLPFSA